MYKHMITFEKLRTTGSLQDHNSSKNHYKMIGIDLSKQQALDADPQAIQKLILLEM